MIDFELTEEQQMIRDSVGAFAVEQMRPAARPADETGEIPRDLIEKLWELGVVTQSAIPEKFGGAGDTRSAIAGAIIAEELGYGDIAIATHALAPRLFAFPILEMGTDQQRERYLKAFAGAKFAAGAAALMEPRFDFDVTMLETTARRDGSGVILNGRKCFVPLAEESDAILVYAQSEPEKGFKGVDGFIVPRNTAGLTILEREKNMGFKALASYGVELKELQTRRGGASWAAKGDQLFAPDQRVARRDFRDRGRHGARGIRVCARLREGAQSVRRADRAETGDRIYARGHGDRDRCDAVAGVGGGVAAGSRRGCA